MKTQILTKKVKPSDLVLAKQFANEIRKRLGSEVVSVVLYGSRARGTAKEDSDMDIFILLQHKPRFNTRAENIVLDAVVNYLNKYNIYISAVTYGINDYRRWKNITPVLYWMEKEGIML